MSKKLISLALAILMVAAMLPASLLSASAEGEVYQFRYAFGSGATASGYAHKTNLPSVLYAGTSGMWKYRMASSNGSTSQIYGNRIWYKGKGINQWLILEINVPTSGTYDIGYEYFRYASTGAIGDVYILPGETQFTGGTSLATLLATPEITKIAEGVDYTDNTGGTLITDGPVCNNVYLSAGKKLLMFASTGFGSQHTSPPADVTAYSTASAHMYPNALVLTTSGATENFSDAYVGELTVGATALDTESAMTTTAAASAWKTSDKSVINAANVTFASSNELVAKVAADGTVTAIGGGTATIYATCSDPTAGNIIGKEITVTGPEHAALNTDAKLYVDVEGADASYITAGDYTVSDIHTVAAGTEITVEATSDDAYEFRYWKTGAGRKIPNSTYTFKAFTNTAIIAVYAPVDDEKATVEFFNGNRQLISTESVDKGTLFSAVTKPADPTLTGYNFRNWGIAGSYVINGDVAAIAQFDNGVAISGFTVNGSTKDDAVYGKEYKETAADSNFKYWTRNGKIISFKDEYIFYAWGTGAAIAKVTGDDAVSARPVAVLEPNGSGYMLEYEIPEGSERVEAGIIFGDNADITVGACYSKAVSQSDAMHGQFTAASTGSDKETFARGYIIYKTGDKYIVRYSD